MNPQAAVFEQIPAVRPDHQPNGQSIGNRGRPQSVSPRVAAVGSPHTWSHVLLRRNYQGEHLGNAKQTCGVGRSHSSEGLYCLKFRGRPCGGKAGRTFYAS